MNNKQTIAIVLIVLAIIFSAVSLYVGSNSVDDVSDDVPQVVEGSGIGGAQVGVIVESAPESAG